MSNFIDLTGKIINRLYINKRKFLDENGNKYKTCMWECICVCGNITILDSQKIRIGHTKSCGCLNKELLPERARNMAAKNIKYEPRITVAREIWQQSYNDGDIDFDNFYILSQQNCFYCNKEPSNKIDRSNKKRSSNYFNKNAAFIYNGIDKINNNLPHNLKNCVSCCTECNRSKRNYSLDDFYQMIKLIYERRNNKPDDYKLLFSKSNKDLSKFKLIEKILLKMYKDIDFDKNLFYFILTLECFYCGEINSNKTKAKNGEIIERNGLDRINNVSHTYSEIVPCCNRCNLSKNNRSASEFFSWAERVYNNLYLKNIDDFKHPFKSNS